MIKRLGLLLLVSGCTSASLQVSDSFDLGGSPVGVASSKTLTLTNTGTGALDLTLHIDGTEFVAASTATHLEPKQSAGLSITFTPEAEGTRQATLSLTDGTHEWKVALVATGTTAQLAFVDEIVLTPTLLIPGETPPTATGILAMRNLGTSGASVSIKSITASDTGLCIGADCTGVIALEVKPLDVVSIALSAVLTVPGDRDWTLTIQSNDVLTPTRTVHVRATATPLVACVFDAPERLTITSVNAELLLHHSGAQPCQVRAARFDWESVSVEIDTVPLPTIVAPGGVFRVGITPWFGGHRKLGVLHVEPTLGPIVDVPVFAEIVVAPAVAPDFIDFGMVGVGCLGIERTFQIYNPDTVPMQIDGLELVDATQSFVLVSAPSTPTTLEPGLGIPVSFSVRFAPTSIGPHAGQVRLAVRGLGTSNVELIGEGTARQTSLDTYRNDVSPQFDSAFIIDTSPSFAARRSAIRERIAVGLTRSASVCSDLRVAFLPAEGAPGAAIDFARSDAGEAWVSASAPDFVNRAMSAFDALPDSSETEACIGPAAAVLLDGGVRPGSYFGALCITDALEHTPSPALALSRLSQAWPSFNWSAYTGLAESSCSIEAADDGVHHQLVSSAFGEQLDVCHPEFWFSRGSTGDTYCPRTTYYLNSRPDGLPTIRHGGVVLPNTQWSFDATLNAVLVTPGVVQSGEVVEISYTPVCFL